MQYRKFGKLDWQPSALGFGCMRLPRLAGSPDGIDQPEAARIIRRAIDRGVNYVDTAYIYPQSEETVGRALQDGYRDRVRVATKLWLEGHVASRDDAQRILEEQLRRLDTGKVDFYLLHALNRERWALVKELALLPWLEDVVRQGLVGYVGFSFHGGTAALKEIVDGYDGWAFCQIQYNYLDETSQAGVEGLRYAHQRGLGVVIMEPLRGGLLARMPVPSVREVLRTAPVERTPANWALRWLWNQPEVSVVLSGMGTMQEVEENVATAEQAGVATMTGAELGMLRRAAQELRNRMAVPCTHCYYCAPCPNGVDISYTFELYNRAKLAGPEVVARLAMAMRSEWEKPACTGCGACQQKCPQGLAVPELLSGIFGEYAAVAAAKTAAARKAPAGAGL